MEKKIKFIKKKCKYIKCPNSKKNKWSSHPNIFIIFNKNKEAICPYCNTKYKLK